MPILGTVASQYSGKPFTAFESISTVVVGGSGSSYIEFTSITDTYKHLQLRGVSRCSFAASGWGEFYIYPNNDNSGNPFADHGLYGSTGAGSAYGYANRNDGAFMGMCARANENSNMFTPFVVNILDYASSSKKKTIYGWAGANNGSSGQVIKQSALWAKTDPITSMRIYPNGGIFTQNSKFALYGIKG